MASRRKSSATARRTARKTKKKAGSRAKPKRKKAGRRKTPARLSLSNLSGAQLVDLLTAGGSKCASVESLAADQAAGAPMNGRGWDLLEMLAWNIRESGHGIG